MGESKSKRIIYIDILNIISILAVILLHHNGIVHMYDSNIKWKISLVIETVFFWAVPVFLMNSGATLMGYRQKYDTKTFFKKRLTKVLIPFVFWIFVMTVWRIATKQLVIEKWSIANILNIVFTNQEETIYYFGFIILGIYLSMPLLSLLAEEKNRKTLWLTVGLFFIFNSTLPVICSLFDITYNLNLRVQIGDFLIFILLGYLLSIENLQKKNRILLYLSAVASICFRYLVTLYLSTKDGNVNRILFDYTQFHSVLLASAVFVFIRNIKWDKIIKKESVINLLGKISSCSFGIYLIHKIIMYYELEVFKVSMFSWKWMTIGAVCTYIISFCIIFILKKIPLIKRVVA